MNDKQLSALIIGSLVAFLFYLNNSGKLQALMMVVKGDVIMAAPPTAAAPAPVAAPPGTLPGGALPPLTSFNGFPQALPITNAGATYTGMRILPTLNNAGFA